MQKKQGLKWRKLQTKLQQVSQGVLLSLAGLVHTHPYTKTLYLHRLGTSTLKHSKVKSKNINTMNKLHVLFKIRNNNCTIWI